MLVGVEKPLLSGLEGLAGLKRPVQVASYGETFGAGWERFGGGVVCQWHLGEGRTARESTDVVVGNVTRSSENSIPA